MPKQPDAQLVQAVNAALSAELSSFSPDAADTPFDVLGFDSFSMLSLRIRIEQVLGSSIGDEAWVALTTPAQLLALVANSHRERRPPDDASRSQHASRRYVLNMPQMAVSGLSESWLFKELGDIHWAMITDGLRVSSSELRDGTGERLYATFSRIRFESTHPLSAFTENEEVVLNGRITRFGGGMFFSDILVSGAAKSIRASVMSTFTKRGVPTSNDALLRGQPFIPPDCPIPALAEMPSFGEAYRRRRSSVLTPPSFECEYQIIPFHDINGVGLLYFAAYPIISDICELRYMRQGNRWASRASTVSRDICYFANCDMDELLIYRVHARQELGPRVEIESSIARAKDGTLMAHLVTDKELIGG